ncbi:MAG: hypothetical protein JXL81_06350 [Deltaproteobacteria bacterium]|nr:hypothetical protein [Deltaproteobacteria bacterium]
MKITIKIGNLSVKAELNDTPTAQKIAGILPFASSFSTWGEEIYFTVPVSADLDESAKEKVEPGDLGYWPTGRAFCIFFGATPMSGPGEIVPASAVNIIGKVADDPEKFLEVMDIREVTIENQE